MKTGGTPMTQETSKYIENYSLSYRCAKYNAISVPPSPRFWLNVFTTGKAPSFDQKTWGFKIIWLVVGPPLWKIWTSIGMIKFPILMGK